MSDWKIALSDLNYGPEEEQAVLRILKSRWLSMGPEVRAFENEFAEFVGVKHAFAVSNGTAALHLSYLALGIGPQDEIIQPAINFVAAANMAIATGARPVFADIVAETEPTIDPADVEARVTERTRALVVMHYGGYLCRMHEIAELCKRKGIAVIEDACHAVGARYVNEAAHKLHGLRSGAIGDIAAFSFFSNKNMAVGEGGMVTTNRDDLAEKVRLLRSHGMTTLTWDRHKGHASTYDVVTPGYNYRLNEIAAALGRCQLARLESGNEKRRNLVCRYRQRLRSSGWVVPFEEREDSAFHLMVVLAPTQDSRQKAVERLHASGIQTSRHYPYIPSLSAHQDVALAGLERSWSFASRVVSLPLCPTMREQDVDVVCEQILAIQV